jgi:hypothetical protein
MDAGVLAAMARWPDVPHVYGWLRLTARGQWRLRGEPIANAAIRDFIGRNYAGDERGCWFFQNGPQRVYVELELAPWVYRLRGDGVPVTHTGARPRELLEAALLGDGRLLLQTDLGPGGVDDRDAARLLPALVDSRDRPLEAEAVERWLDGDGAAWLAAGRLGLRGGRVPLRRMNADDLGARYGYERQPAAGGSG